MANVMTPEFRVSYPAVFKPQVNNLNGKSEFSVTMLFDKKADLAALKNAAKEAIEVKWGKDKAKWPKGLRLPFRDQAEKAKEVDGKQVLPAGYEEGATFITARSNQRPGVIDRKKDDIIDETEFYAGCYARATLRAYTYDQSGNRGVSFGLQNLQKLRDGERLGGRTAAQDDFSAVEGGDDPFGDIGKKDPLD